MARRFARFAKSPNPRILAVLLHARIIPYKFLAYVASDVTWDIRHYESDPGIACFRKFSQAQIGLVMANIPRDIRGHVGQKFSGDDPSMQKCGRNSRIRPYKFLAYVASDVTWDIRHYGSDLSIAYFRAYR